MSDYMYPYKLEITGSRIYSDQYWRVNRIHLILGYAQALADIDDNENYYKKLKSIDDNKGLLTIEWKVKSSPTQKEKEYIKKGYESIVTDYECDPIRHIVNGKEE